MQAPPDAVVGCLLDVSGSMRSAIETGRGDERASDRLRAILRAALNLAKAEQHHNPNALMFVGAFGMKDNEAPFIDLCGLLGGILDRDLNSSRKTNGREELIALANSQGISHITHFIETKLSEHEARIVHEHLQQHPQDIEEFVRIIPDEGTMAGHQRLEHLGEILGFSLLSQIADAAAEQNDALKMARRICKTWMRKYEDLTAKPVSEVIPLLDRLQDHPSMAQRSEEQTTLLDDLKSYIYGWTPMRAALRKAETLYDRHTRVKHRVLVLISDGVSTDGHPLSLAESLRTDGVLIASIFLTSDETLPRRCLYDRLTNLPRPDEGRKVLFSMASKVSVLQHPVSALAAIGWAVPSSGECSLHAQVCSSDALSEFCSILLSARFGSADALLDIVGKVDVDAVINDRHVRTCQNPSDQLNSGTCYAHAAAAVLHMSLVRIYNREGGCPTIPEIRHRILQAFPPGDGGHNSVEVLEEATKWYRPLRFKEVDEDGARQAVLHRRPVLARFRLSHTGWDAFANYFDRDSDTRNSTLSQADMQPHVLSHEPNDAEDGGGHAVVLFRCDPNSLTFLNSWGSNWGQNGTFAIENAQTLRLSTKADWGQMSFYDVFWYEKDLTTKERQAYQERVDEKVRSRAQQHPSLLELDFECPLCKKIAPLADFSGNLLRATCPNCRGNFKPETENLVRALYVRSGVGDNVQDSEP